MPFHVIIPARYDSSRLPGKPLADIHGQSMIERVYRQAEKAGAKTVAIATDDERIEAHVTQFGGKAIMTRNDHQSGTDRIREACEKLNLQDDDIVINVQGDEPFIPPETIRQVADLLTVDDSVMSTLCTPINDRSELSNPNVVKVVLSKTQKALYFSRAAIPFDRDGSHVENKDLVQSLFFRHLGIYGFKFRFLKIFSELPVSDLESLEKLEQLRALENGYSINIDVAIKVPPLGVDTKDDLHLAIRYAEEIEG